LIIIKELYQNPPVCHNKQKLHLSLFSYSWLSDKTILDGAEIVSKLWLCETRLIFSQPPDDIISGIMTVLSESSREPCEGDPHPSAIKGMEAFNQGHYFEAHEDLEAAWREEMGPVRDLYRAILQVGVVYLHITRLNYAGAIKVYQRSQKWLRLWPDTCRGIAIQQLRQDLDEVMTALQQLGPENIADFDLSMFKPILFLNSDNP
jgi:predicted metal-dependent hydrolase